jgi:RNA polymerase sigma-70 factor, ECF subfamily
MSNEKIGEGSKAATTEFEQMQGQDQGLERSPEVEDRNTKVGGWFNSVDQQKIATLVSEVQKADESEQRQAAFDEIARQAYPDVFSLAEYLTGSKEDGEDVAQNALTRAWRHIGKFRGESLFSTWLHRITTNAALTHLSKRQRYRQKEELGIFSDDLSDEETTLIVPVDNSTDHNPETQTENTLLSEQLDKALQGLKLKYRQVVILRNVYDMPYAEVANVLGITENAAKVRLHRALKSLRDELFPDGLPLTEEK